MYAGRRRLRVGVIGGGWVAAARHIPAFQRDRRAEVVAIYDRRRERAADLSRKFGIRQVCGDLSELLDQKPDIVTICTSPWTHASLAIDCLKNGCHVFVEKPMALNSDEAAAMVEMARQTGRQLCVSHNFLFSRSMRRARSLIDRGEVGPVRHVLAIQSSSPNRRLPKWYPDLPGGLFFDESPHMIYLLEHFLGDIRVDHVRAQIAPTERRQPLDVVEASLSGHGVTASLNMIFVAPISEWLVVVFGERRILLLDIFRDILTVMKPDGSHSPADILVSSSRVLLQELCGFASSGILYVTDRLLYGHEVIVERFISSVLGIAPPPVAPERSLVVMRTMEEILKHIPGLDARRTAPASP